MASQVNNCNTRNRPVNTSISNQNKPTQQLKLIKKLSKLVIEVVNEKFGGEQDLIHFLISYYDNTSNNVFTSNLFLNKSDDKRKVIIEKHCKMFTYKQPNNKTRRSYFRGPRDMNLTIDLSDAVKTSNFAYLMYLDMEHDDTLPMIFDDKNKKMKKMTFDDFCKSTYYLDNNKRERKTPVWYFFGDAIEPVETSFILKMKDVMGKTATGKESRIKAAFEQIYDNSNAVKNAIELKKSEITPYIIKNENFLYWLVDQEDQARTATRSINRTAIRTAYTTNNIQNKNKRVKSIYPLITVANFMDPGEDLIIDSAKADSEFVMTDEPKSRLTYNYHKPKFTIKHQLGETNLEVYYSQRLDRTVKEKVKDKVKDTIKRIGRGYGIYLSNSKHKQRYRNKTYPECVFRLSGKISKDKAKRFNTSQARLSKFLGDFLQVLTAVRTIQNTQNRGTYHYALTTGDTMMANMFLYICTVNGITPKLWFLTSALGTAKVIGLNNIIEKPNRQNAGRAGSEITGVPSERPNAERVNNKNNATSRNSTSQNSMSTKNRALAGMLGKIAPQPKRSNSVAEGSGNSGNTATSRNNGTGATRIQVVNANNSNNNMNNANRKLAAALGKVAPRPQAQKRKRNNTGSPPVRGPNAQSGVGSRSSIVGNKINNLNNNASFSGNSQPNNRNAMIANLRAQLARARAAVVESTQAANAARRQLQSTQNAQNINKVNAAQKAKNNANARRVRAETRMKTLMRQLQTNAALAGAQQNQGPRRSGRRKL